jgi:hypothetical protein
VPHIPDNHYERALECCCAETFAARTTRVSAHDAALTRLLAQKYLDSSSDCLVPETSVMLKVDPELASSVRIGSHVRQSCHCTVERLAPPRPCLAPRCAGSCIPGAASLRLRTVQHRRTMVCSSATDGHTLQKTVLEAQVATAENFRPFGQVRARHQLEVTFVTDAM